MSKRKYDWNALRAQYLEGSDSLCEIARRSGVPKSTIYNKSSCEGWAAQKKMAEGAFESEALQRACGVCPWDTADEPSQIFESDTASVASDSSDVTVASDSSDCLFEGAPSDGSTDGDAEGEALKNVLFDGYKSSEKLSLLRKISQILTRKIGEAVFDELQFNRYLVPEKGFDENGKSITVTTEKLFDKLDTKALKEMASTLKVLTDCVRNLYGIPTFGETSKLYLASRTDAPEDSDSSLTVTFLDGEEFAN